MTWVRRTGEQPKHQCEFPRGSLGDIWRCDICGSLWVCGEACDGCHHYGVHPYGGQHLVGVKWRPGSWWQRFKHRNEGRVMIPEIGGDPGVPTGDPDEDAVERAKRGGYTGSGRAEDVAPPARLSSGSINAPKAPKR